MKLVRILQNYDLTCLHVHVRMYIHVYMCIRMYTCTYSVYICIDQPSHSSIKHVSDESSFLWMHYLIITLLQFAEGKYILDVHSRHCIICNHFLLETMTHANTHT